MSYLNQAYSPYSGRLFVNWNPSSATGEQESYEIPELRLKSRDLYRNNPVARGIVNTISNGVVGRGLKLQSIVNYRRLGISQSAGQEIEKEIEEKFYLYSESLNIDASRRFNFYKLQNLFLINRNISGDVFALLPSLEDNETPVKLAVNLLEADQINTPFEFSKQENIYGGIEIGLNGRPIKYYIQTNKDKYVKIYPKTSSGRPLILHDGNFDRIGQIRGVPILTPILETIKRLDSALKHDTINWENSSKFTFAIKSPVRDLSDFLPTNLEVTGQSDKVNYNLEAGAGLSLRPGEEIQFFDTKYPNISSPEFAKFLISISCMGLTIPFEAIYKYYQSSYSAARAAINDAWNYFLIERSLLSYNFCQPIFRLWLDESVANGDIDLPNYFDNYIIREAYSGNRWIGDAQRQIDPVKEVNAAISKIQSGLSTYSQETTQLTGENWDDTIQRLSNELKIKQELGVYDAQSKVGDGNDSIPASPENIQ